MKTIKIKYLGERLPKRVMLPIPFESKCLQTGEVICDPIGEFPEEDGMRLLQISGKNGLFQLVEETEEIEEIEEKRPTHTRPTAWISRKKAERYKENFGLEGEVVQNKKGFWEIIEVSTVPAQAEG